MNAMKSYIAYWACMVIASVWFASNTESTLPHAWVGFAFFLIALCFHALHNHKDKQEKKTVDTEQ